MQKSNTAMRLLMAMGLGDLMLRTVSLAPEGYSRRPVSRHFRNSMIRLERKAEYTGRSKLARKAHMGEIGLRGPRGLQVRRVDGVLRITR